MNAEFLYCVVLFLTLVGAIARLGRQSRPAARPALAMLVIGALILALRLLLAPPSFMHTGLHGTSLLVNAYQHPTSSYREYGPVGYVLLGTAMHVFGCSLAVSAFINQLASTITLLLIAWLAVRWTGDRRAAVFVIALGALDPALVRLGASEEIHNLAVLLAWVAILLVDRYVETGSTAAIVGSLSALLLMLETRQTMISIAPFIPLLGLAATPAGARQRRPLWIAAGIVVAVAAVRVLFATRNPDQAGHIAMFLWRLSDYRRLLPGILHHPLFDVGRLAAHLLPLLLIGGAWMAAQSARMRVFLAMTAVQFAATAWLWFGQGEALPFRLPVLSMGIFIAGLGAWRIVVFLDRRLAAPRFRAPATAALAALLAVAPMLQPGFAELVPQVAPMAREYEFIRRTAPALPRRLILVEPSHGSPVTPSYSFPSHLLDEAGIDYQVVNLDHLAEQSLPEGVPLVFIAGVQCSAYSLLEVMGLQPTSLASLEARGDLADMLQQVADRRLAPGVQLPDGQRPTCRAVLQGARLIGAAEDVPTSNVDFPFLIYYRPVIPIGFYELDPATARQVSAGIDLTHSAEKPH